jgi:hypothetical protein
MVAASMSQQVTSVCRATQVVNRRAEWRFGCSLTEILIGVDGGQNITNVAASQQQNICRFLNWELSSQMNRGGVANRVKVGYDISDYWSIHDSCLTVSR